MSGTSAGEEGREIVFTRVFDAPRELVFETWTKPEHLAHWWGPHGWSLTFCNLDLRPGGVWHYCFSSEAGQESWGRAVYREISPPKRLVWVDTFSDPEGNVTSQEMLMTATFEEQDGKTLMTLHTLFESPAHRDEIVGMGMIEGMNQTLDRLEELLATFGNGE
jgi:uncharacterized protein YndB with AHSA1/START domain